MPSVNESKAPSPFWRGPKELATCAALRDFARDSAEAIAAADPSRRRFLQLMGASLGLAGATACRWPEEKIAPAASRPEGRVPGAAVYYATSMERAGAALGLLAASYDGRPVKIEGNPSHLASQGATDAVAQAAILELYDPDRLKRPIRRTPGASASQTWEDFDRWAAERFAACRQSGGERMAVLAESSSSPSQAAMRRRFREVFPKAAWHEYEPVSRDNEREGARLAFGRPVRSVPALEEADVILALDADFLMNHPWAIANARAFAETRRGENGRMSRLYAVESRLSATGASADRRLPVRSGAVAGVAARLARELAAQGLALPDWLRQALNDSPTTDAGAAPDEDAFVAAAARDLAQARERGLILVGESQPAALHALAHALNAVLGAAGRTVEYAPDFDEDRPAHLDSIRGLAQACAAGTIDTLLILGGNPAYDAPADLQFAAALDHVEMAAHLTLYENETSLGCDWTLPRAHFLEEWGDGLAHDGSWSQRQPLIEPLYRGRSPVELLAQAIGGGPARGYDIARETFRSAWGETDFEARWRQALHDGGVAESAPPAILPALRPNAEWVRDLAASNPPQAESLELVFAPDYRLWDGRYANNGWLQELPDPITKLVWGNPALLAPATAESLGLRNGDVVRLSIGGRAIEAPAFVLPGQAPGSVALALGHGRTRCGRAGDGVGVNAYALRTAEAMHFATGLSIEKTGRREILASSQADPALGDLLAAKTGGAEAQKRVAIYAREASYEHYREHPDFAKHIGPHHGEAPQLWAPVEYNGRRWGMAIDLSLCIGCGACVAACQAENNIPVVGARETGYGRGMHWLRVDRYFAGDPANPRVVFQPVACHHCENAPCEQVCPVAATVHSAEGLNDMVYNRCVGTRYCSNNCPYKVRRFNYFNNHKHLSEIEKLAFNPDVTVRSRGVMEKCTYCVQRIAHVRIEAKNERRYMRDGEAVPACAQVCPAGAIVFGDLSDPSSRVSKLHAHPRAYALLEELNVRPRTKYLARLRNPGGEAAGANEGQHA